MLSAFKFSAEFGTDFVIQIACQYRCMLGHIHNYLFDSFLFKFSQQRAEQLEIFVSGNSRAGLDEEVDELHPVESGA